MAGVNLNCDYSRQSVSKTLRPEETKALIEGCAAKGCVQCINAMTDWRQKEQIHGKQDEPSVHRIGETRHARASSGPNLNTPAMEDFSAWLDGQEFYELMQVYRNSGLYPQSSVMKAFEAVKTAIRDKLRIWHSLLNAPPSDMVPCMQLCLGDVVKLPNDNTYYRVEQLTPTIPGRLRLRATYEQWIDPYNPDVGTRRIEQHFGLDEAIVVERILRADKKAQDR